MFKDVAGLKCPICKMKFKQRIAFGGHMSKAS